MPHSASVGTAGDVVTGVVVKSSITCASTTLLEREVSVTATSTLDATAKGTTGPYGPLGGAVTLTTVPVQLVGGNPMNVPLRQSASVVRAGPSLLLKLVTVADASLAPVKASPRRRKTVSLFSVDGGKCNFRNQTGGFDLPGIDKSERTHILGPCGVLAFSSRPRALLR